MSSWVQHQLRLDKHNCCFVRVLLFVHLILFQTEAWPIKERNVNWKAKQRYLRYNSTQMVESSFAHVGSIQTC